MQSIADFTRVENFLDDDILVLQHKHVVVYHDLDDDFLDLHVHRTETTQDVVITKFIIKQASNSAFTMRCKMLILIFPTA